MPLFRTPLRAALPLRIGLLTPQWLRPQRRAFSTWPPLRHDDHKNHYETLNVRTDASQADIKKSFYSLSKTHHPDHNPSDPHAPKRFMRISEAYNTLSHADRRARYDRDTLRLHKSNQHHASRHGGSYASTGPVGGRPASGLSRRRGTFTGPPPSFYRSGGWGAHAARRKAAHEDSTGMGPGAAGMAGTGGMGPGQDPAHNSDGTAPHFDHVGHERMHRRREERRSRRGGDEDVPVVDTGLWGRFVFVGGIVLAAGYVPWWFANRDKATGSGKKRKREAR